MCGITGGYNISKQTIEKMVEATTHRGPDATGIKTLSSVIFGHNRLAIIDTSDLSNQPMISSNERYMLVFNGEIYNFKELKKQLPNWDFKSEGDSEVLLASLVTWGEDALKKIQGIFAFGFYDREEDSVLLARDHMGVKPLYYESDGNHLLFSSELKGIIKSIHKPKLSLEAVSQFLHFNYVPSPKTLICGVHKLQPGHVLKFQKGKSITRRYYKPIKPFKKGVEGEDIQNVIGDEVTSQLVSDRPLGVLLSGGFDSSIVLHHASQSNKMKTFSTGFEMSTGAESEHGKFNADAEVAKITAKHYGSEHTSYMISLEMIREEMISIVEQLDEPVSSPTQISQFMLSRFIRQEGIVVALGGDGGDELWGGYIRHTAVLSAQYFQHLPRFIQKSLGYIHPRVAKLSQPLGADIHWNLTALDQTALKRVLKVSLPRENDKNVVKEQYNKEEFVNLSPIEQFMRADRGLWLADDALQRTDRSSMASGVELRVPLLGMPVVNFADSIYAEKKFSFHTSKEMLKDSYKGYLPDHLYKQPKRGWMAPGAKWLRDPEIEKIVRSILSEEYYDGLSELFDWKELQELLTEHISVKGYHLNPIWNILVLQVWARKFNVRV